GLASMGPSTAVDGDPRLFAAAASLHEASMGPSTAVDGDAFHSPASSGGPKCFNGAVDCCRRRLRYTKPRAVEHSQLQWGRRLLSTETILSPDEAGWFPAGFNGAVDCCRRRHTAGSTIKEAREALQWGRRLLSTETSL